MGNKNLEKNQQLRQKMEKILALIKDHVDNYVIKKERTYFVERADRGLTRQPDQAYMVKVAPVTKRFAGHIGPEGDMIQFWGNTTREYVEGRADNESSQIQLTHYYDAKSYKHRPLGGIQTKQKTGKGLTDATQITVESPYWQETNGADVITRIKIVNGIELGKVKIRCSGQEYEQGAEVVIDRIYNALICAKQKEDAIAKKLSKLNLSTQASVLTKDNSSQNCGRVENTDTNSGREM